MNPTFELGSDQDLDAALKDILSEEVQYINYCLSDYNDLKTSVHESRKSFKKIRSLLRLLRVEAGEEWFTNHNQFYRDLAAEISDLRDAHVLIESVELLHHQNLADEDGPGLNAVVEHLETSSAQKERQVVDEQLFDKIVNALHGKDSDLPAWPVIDNDLLVLIPGLNLIYKDGYDHMYRAFIDPSAHNFHEWRKDVKHLYHMRMLFNRFWPPSINYSSEDLKELSDHLGLEHDLAVLNDVLDLIDTDTEFIAEAITKKRGKIQNMAKYMGKLIFDESPEYHMRHFEDHWQTVSIDG